jgi:acyl carrier protein
MNDEEIRAVVHQALRAVAPEADPGTLDASVDLRDQLDIDSMDFLNFIIGLDERTGVNVPERDYGKLGTIDACVAYISERLHAGAPS